MEGGSPQWPGTRHEPCFLGRGRSYTRVVRWRCLHVCAAYGIVDLHRRVLDILFPHPQISQTLPATRSSRVSQRVPADMQENQTPSIPPLCLTVTEKLAKLIRYLHGEFPIKQPGEYPIPPGSLNIPCPAPPHHFSRLPSVWRF